MELLVTVDIEGGESPDPYESVDRVESVLETLAVPATLFVTPDVVRERPAVVDAWRRGDHRVGLHVHPSRLASGRSAEVDLRADYLTEYTRTGIVSLLTEALEVFEDVLDFRPSVFRAGRWEYSDRLLSALEEQGFTHDSSLRPTGHTTPYRQGGVAEIPMTVYDNPVVNSLLRFWDLKSVPLHADAFLSRLPTTGPFYAVTWRLLASNRPYLMVSIHDYDVVPRKQRNRIERYLEWLTERAVPATVDEMTPETDL